MRMSTASPIRVVVFQRRHLDREALAALFRQAVGYKVLAFPAGACDVISVCSQLRPDVVVLDASTPEGNSHLVAGVLAHNRYARCTLLLDDESNEQRELDVLRLPNAAYLTRHASFKELTSRIVAQLSCNDRSQSTDAQPPLPTIGPRVRRQRSDRRHLLLLSEREIEVARLLAEGNSVRQCADRLRLSPSTVDNHKTRLMKKLQIHKTVELVHFAILMGIVSPGQ